MKKEADPLEKVQGDWPAAACWPFVGGFITVMDECRTKTHFGCPDELRAQSLQFPVGWEHLSFCEWAFSFIYLFMDFALISI